MDGSRTQSASGVAGATARCNSTTHTHREGGFWLAWLGFALLAVALTLGAHNVAYFPGDLHLARELQAIHLPLIGGLLNAETTIGSPLWALVIIGLIAAVLLLRRLWWAAAIFAVTNALWAVDALLKALVGRPRPSPALLHVSARVSGASFPSGHVFSAVLLYGIVIMLLARLPLPRALRWGGQALALLIVAGMGPARIYAGAHWPSDVLGAYLWAGLLLALVLQLSHGGRAVPWHHVRRAAAHIPPPAPPVS